MIKISKDNLVFWRLFGVGFFVAHVFVMVCIVGINILPLYLIYLFFAVGHFAIGRVWRYLFIVDTYLSADFKSIIFKTAKSGEQHFNVSQVTKCKTRAGITDVVVDSEGTTLRFYFMIDDKNNLKYLSPEYWV